MSRRDNTDKRCSQCAMHLGLCICELVPRLEPQNRLCLVIHYKEARKTTNSGALACRSLRGSEQILHGAEGKPTLPPWSGGEDAFPKSLLLYPADDSMPLSRQHVSEGPVRLVVPDGNWRQAAKMTRRVEWMASLPKVTLPAGQTTRYRVRFEPKLEGLATMEAIARAFRILEGEEIAGPLEEVFQIMVDRTLYSRGMIRRDQVRGGLPPGFERHEPLGSKLPK